MTSDHRATRPAWLCASCGLPWPCPAARHSMLAVAAGEDSALLQRHLLRLLIVAERDLGVADLPGQYRRFVGWALAVGESCRLCGSTRHAVVAGTPPRLVPCNRLRELAARPAGEVGGQP